MDTSLSSFGFLLRFIYALYTFTTMVNSNHSRQRSHIWAQQAIEFIKRWDCSRFQPDSDATIQCSTAKTVLSSQIRLYVATGSAPDLQATLPDQRLTGDSHEAFLVLDPFPDFSFGHLVFIFAVDSVANRDDCQKDTQSLIQSHNDCLQLILKRCNNDATNSKRSEQAAAAAECATNFIPFVFELKNVIPTSALHETKLKQKLTCLTGVSQFAPCPAHLKIGSKQHKIKRFFGDVCESQSSTLDHQLALADCAQNMQARLSKSVRCEWLETCDHVAIVAGVWNHPPGKFQMEESLQRLRDDLTINHKFAGNNMKTFYADGKTVTANLSLHNLYPASFKHLVRSHLRQVCQKLYCVDTFAVFLIGPGKRDGSLLLWDKDFDGFASENETYSPSEIYEDLSSCEANRLYIVADYAYSGQLAEYFENASSSANSDKDVIVLTSGHLPSVEHRLTKVWSDQQSIRTCFTDAVSSSLYHVTTPFPNSEPKIFDGSRGETRTAISGNRCNDIGGSGDRAEQHSAQETQDGCSEKPLAWFWRDKAKNKQRNRQNSNSYYQQDESFLSPNSNETTSKHAPQRLSTTK